MKFKKGQSEVNNTNVIGKFNEQKKEEGFLSVFGSFLNSVKQTAGDVAGKITKEIDDLKIKDKLKEAGDTMVDYAKAGGNFIKDKSQQALNSDFVQGITKTAESGINTVIEKTKVLLNNDKNNQKQNINPELLKNEANENEAKKEEDIQMSEIINNDNNTGNINDIQNINNNIMENNNKENQNEVIENQEDIKEEKVNTENKNENKESEKDENTGKDMMPQKVEEESIKHEPENPQNP